MRAFYFESAHASWPLCGVEGNRSYLISLSRSLVLPNKLRIRLTPSILRAGCGMADQNWPAHVSDSQGDADRRGNSSLLEDGRF